MRQIRLDLDSAHLPWMTLAMEKDEPAYPLHIGLLGPVAVSEPPNAVADLVQKTRSVSSYIAIAPEA